ncbi:hypothetical protein [uncultured Bacteroides sp.]|nr:hypothetical protein [uncultured Bacteroides sp.]
MPSGKEVESFTECTEGDSEGVLSAKARYGSGSVRITKELNQRGI